MLPQETAKLPFLKWTVLTVQFGEGKKKPTSTAIGSRSAHLLLYAGHLHLQHNKEQMLGD